MGTVFYAANHVIGRGVHAEIPPVGLSFWRWFLGAVILLPFIMRDLIASSAIIKTNIRSLSLLGCTMLGSTTLILIALNYASAINISLINTTQPVMTVVLAWLIFREKLVRSQVIGIAAGLLGVLIMVSRVDWAIIAELDFNPGDFIALLAIVGYAFYAINIRFIPRGLKPTVSLFVIIITGCLGLLPFYIVETLLYRPFPVNMTSIVTVIILALTTSLIGMLVWNEGNRIIGPSRAGMFINLIPVFTAVFAITFLGEQLHLYHLSGALLISTGIFLVLRK
ncbi:MAG: drug/metabolite transporter (DMT)-like permease [Gammaproteobacteria bacterium]|jgi:drug/metabolite transporter (DMT)-like permease